MRAFRVVVTPTSKTMRVPGTQVPLTFTTLRAACRVATTLELAVDARVHIDDFFRFERGLLIIDDGMGRFGNGPSVHFGREFHVRETRATAALDEGVGMGRYYLRDYTFDDVRKTATDST
jgi:hypothetical protein